MMKAGAPGHDRGEEERKKTQSQAQTKDHGEIRRRAGMRHEAALSGARMRKRRGRPLAEPPGGVMFFRKKGPLVPPLSGSALWSMVPFSGTSSAASVHVKRNGAT